MICTFSDVDGSPLAADVHVSNAVQKQKKNSHNETYIIFVHCMACMKYQSY